MSDRPTPISDEWMFHPFDNQGGDSDEWVVEVEIARRLERQRDAAVEALKMGMEIGDGCSRGFLAKFQEQVRAVLREIEGES